MHTSEVRCDIAGVCERVSVCVFSAHAWVCTGAQQSARVCERAYKHPHVRGKPQCVRQQVAPCCLCLCALACFGFFFLFFFPMRTRSHHIPPQRIRRPCFDVGGGASEPTRRCSPERCSAMALAQVERQFWGFGRSHFSTSMGKNTVDRWAQ